MYRKVINFGILPNATLKSVSTGMTLGSYVCVGIYGIALNTGNYTVLTLPDIGSSNYIRVYHSGTSNEIIIDTNVDRTNFYGYVTIQYTKTTD